MSRKQLKTPEIIDANIDEAQGAQGLALMRQEAGDLALAQAQHESAVRAVALQVGYQLPADCIDPDLIQRDVCANMRRSVEACLEVGRGLAVLKQACGHGNFLARLDVMGIPDGVARKFIQAARKFSNRSTSTDLTRAIGSQSKLFELLILDDDQLEELELTGQTGELKIDDIATMSVKELRAALRETREELEDTRTRSAEKSQQIEVMHEEKLRIKRMPPDEVLAALHKEATAIHNDACGAIAGQLRQAVIAILGHHETHGGDSAVFLGGVVGQLESELAKLRGEFGLPAVQTGEHDWVGEA